ncbi:MAG: hypothetical protein MUF83_13065 [Acidimicrobiales bacterium]|jgi:hypothetical protein|nr:hypothetical protein [Acidimicrobiales bacterium]
MNKAITGLIGGLLLGGFLLLYGINEADAVKCGTLLMDPGQVCEVDGDTRSYEEQKDATAADNRFKMILGGAIVAGSVVLFVARAAGQRRSAPSVRPTTT